MLGYKTRATSYRLIKAEQYLGGVPNIPSSLRKGSFLRPLLGLPRWRIHTTSGYKLLEQYDFIVKYSDGWYDVISSNEFHFIYEAVNND